MHLTTQLSTFDNEGADLTRLNTGRASPSIGLNSMNVLFTMDVTSQEHKVLSDMEEQSESERISSLSSPFSDAHVVGVVASGYLDESARSSLSEGQESRTRHATESIVF